MGPLTVARVRRALLMVAVVLATVAADAPPPRLALQPSLEYVATHDIGGVPYVGANEFGRLLEATRYWRADVRKLELRRRSNRIVLSLDNPFVLMDERTIMLKSSVRSQGGELQVPASIADELSSGDPWPRLLHDPRRKVVLVVPAEGVVRSLEVSSTPRGTRIVFPADRPEGVVVAGRSRARFRLRFEGLFSGTLPDSGEADLLHGARAIPTTHGSAFELRIAPQAAGFRLERDVRRGRVELHLLRDLRADDEAFAPEAPPGPRFIRTIVLDPGHGGLDVGTRAAGAIEKDLTLALARRVRDVLRARMHVRVVLTRESDRTLSMRERAQFANRMHADLVIALHFDGFEGAQAAGATAYCPPATQPEDARSTTREAWAPRSWRLASLQHAVQSRDLAEALLSRLELSGQGPTRLRESLPYSMLGIDAPGVLLECATLTSASDRARVTRDGGIDALAETIASGIEAYQRNE